MKLGIANRISVSDVDLEDTVPDIRPSYSDCLLLLDAGDDACDRLSQDWLDMISGEVL